MYVICKISNLEHLYEQLSVHPNVNLAMDEFEKIIHEYKPNMSCTEIHNSTEIWPYYGDSTQIPYDTGFDVNDHIYGNHLYAEWIDHITSNDYVGFIIVEIP